jgi:oligo-alginate lyase
MMKAAVVGLMMTCLVLLAGGSVSGKQCSRFVTAQMRANAVANIAKFEWATARQNSAIAAAERWVTMSDDELWAFITSQELPRDRYTNIDIGCPNCGKQLSYDWIGDPWNKPWKLKCPKCGEVYPKNDFYAFYKTALDEHGFFRRELGDRTLLFNADHPDPKDPLHKVYVDDGYGMMDENENEHHIIAYYNEWLQWRTVFNGLPILAQAYALTGDNLYAHKAAVLLDRIADVYPDMDFLGMKDLGFRVEPSHRGYEGGIINRIWETNMGNYMARTYDIIYDGILNDEALVAFCSRQAEHYKLGPKSSIEALCTHIEDNLLMKILEAVKSGKAHGNTGMDHRCLATTAIALDRGEVTKEWLDWLFDPGFPGEHMRVKNPVPWVLVEGLDRDGMGGECGNYGRGWTNSMILLAEMLAAYPEYKSHDMVAEYPKLRQAFFIDSRLHCLDAAMPRIGDTGGAIGGWIRYCDPVKLVRGYKLYKDPRMATLAWRYAEERPAKLRLESDIFERDPDALAEEIATVAKPEEFRLKCEHLGRYGQAVLQTEAPENGRALWIHYGYGKGHSHADSLNIGIFAHNVDMLPEMGYPEYTGPWPKRMGWTSHTISHNTLMINDTKSVRSPGGKINLFTVQPPLRAIDISSEGSYKGIDTYRRTVAMVDVSDTNSYVLDVFRARGGKNHRLLYHGPGNETVVTGLSLTQQARGTFAGQDVKFGEFYDGAKGWNYQGSGFMYLSEVQRSESPVRNAFTVDWNDEGKHGRIKKGHAPRLRLHALTPCDEVALASGQPPKPERECNPPWLRYLIQSRLGENMESQFITVLEPYDTTPFISRVRALQVTHDADRNSVAAVAVELADGTVDILISCEERTRVEVEGGVKFDGRFGLVRLTDGEVRTMRMSDATLLSHGEIKLEAEQPAYEGTVTAINADDPTDHRVSLDSPLPQGEELVGGRIHFYNAVPLDTTYEIKAVTPDGISTGEITIMWGLEDCTDFTAGYKYLVNVGDRFVIPNHVGLDR